MDIDLILEDEDFDIDEPDEDLELDLANEEDVDFDMDSDVEDVEDVGEELNFPCIVIKDIYSLEEVKVDYNYGKGFPVYIKIEESFKRMWEIDMSFNSLINLFMIKEYDIIYFDKEGNKFPVDVDFIERRVFNEAG